MIVICSLDNQRILLNIDCHENSKHNAGEISAKRVS
jgi:hypothetical protein